MVPPVQVPGRHVWLDRAPVQRPRRVHLLQGVQPDHVDDAEVLRQLRGGGVRDEAAVRGIERVQRGGEQLRHRARGSVGGELVACRGHRDHAHAGGAQPRLRRVAGRGGHPEAVGERADRHRRRPALTGGGQRRLLARDVGPLQGHDDVHGCGRRRRPQVGDLREPGEHVARRDQPGRRERARTGRPGDEQRGDDGEGRQLRRRGAVVWWPTRMDERAGAVGGASTSVTIMLRLLS